MAHWICRAIASEREFMVFVMVLIATAAFRERLCPDCNAVGF